MTSARVRLGGIVGFVSVVGITLAVWGDLPNYEKLLKLEHITTCHHFILILAADLQRLTPVTDNALHQDLLSLKYLRALSPPV